MNPPPNMPSFGGGPPPNRSVVPSPGGGVPLQRVPVIPWNAFVACGLQVHKDGKIKLVIFDPQPMITADEAFQTIRLLIAAQGQKPGPLAWETVPEEVQRHFKFKDDEPAVPSIEAG